MSGDVLTPTDWKHSTATGTAQVMPDNKNHESQARLKSAIRPSLGRRALSHWKKAVGATLLAIGLSQTPAAPIITDTARNVTNTAVDLEEEIVHQYNLSNPDNTTPAPSTPPQELTK